MATRFPTLLDRRSLSPLSRVPTEEDVAPNLRDKSVERKISGRNEWSRADALHAVRGAGVTAGASRSPRVFPKEAALALQADLMMAFNTPSFQRQLHEISRQFEKQSPSFKKAFLKLVRSVQWEILPDYGFEQSEEGIEAMLWAFKKLKDDQDIQVNTAAINDLLTPVTEDEEKEKEGLPAVVQKPSTKFRVLDLLQLMLKEFGKASFQRDIKELKLAANYNSRRVFDPSRASANFEDPDGYFELEGRDDLALIVQQAILPGFGFEASEIGRAS